MQSFILITAVDYNIEVLYLEQDGGELSQLPNSFHGKLLALIHATCHSMPGGK